MVLALTVLICSIASLLGSIAVLITTVRVHRTMEQIERTHFGRRTVEVVDARSPITECASCHRYWVPNIFGPQVGEPCPECKKPVTRSPASSSR